MMRRSLTRFPAVAALATLFACAAPQVRPELAVINSPIDDVWVTFVEVVREWGFEIESMEPSKHEITATKDTTTVIAGASDPSQRFAASKRQQRHDLKISMRSRGDQSTAIEIRYTTDKVADEEAAFALFNFVRERLALKGE